MTAVASVQTKLRYGNRPDVPITSVDSIVLELTLRSTFFYYFFIAAAIPLYPIEASAG